MKRSLYKTIALTLLVGIIAMACMTGFAGCKSEDEPENTSSPGDNTEKLGDISVITREPGSGTRDAFIELTEILVKGADGSKTDRTSEEAAVIDSTQGVMSSVAGDKAAIGYISLGSLNDTVKAVKVEGVEATAANVKNASYKISRPFNIATKEGLNDAGKDFVNFIMSKEGQDIINAKGYIAVDDNAAAYSGSKPGGTVKVAGSSSVSPVMEKLIEEYKKVNPNANVEMNTTDSSAGITALQGGTCDIAMASREIKDSEIGEGSNKLTPTKIAMDGIAVIVNKNNSRDNLKIEQIMKIFIGEIEKWEEIE